MINECAEKLKSAGVKNPFQEALWITAHALGIGTTGVFAKDKYSPDEIQRINALISRRADGEPLQYIIGEADFYSRDFYVGRGVLIPRHDTETLIEGVRMFFAPDKEFRFLDWGTGSGCIGATILLEFPRSTGVMYDISDEALKYARKNIERYGLEDRAEISSGKFTGDFDLVISNPPYIPSAEIQWLMRDVKDFEPITALDGGDDGMKFYGEILSSNVKRGGYIILEIGNFFQIMEIETFKGFQMAGRVLDTGNFPRCILLRRL